MGEKPLGKDLVHLDSSLGKVTLSLWELCEGNLEGGLL
jgi:hypothetical protein